MSSLATLPRFLGLLLASALVVIACDEAITDTENQPPTVEIVAPSDGAEVLEGQAVTLEGAASDPEDGELSGAAVGWASDVDGELGTGLELTVSDLSVGSHQVLFGAQDSEGAGDTASIGLTVVPPTAGVVINEVENRHIDGPRHGDDYVELYVAADGTLNGRALELVAMDGTVYGRTELSGTVEAGDFVLIGADSVDGADFTFAGVQDGPGAAVLTGAEGDTVDAAEWGGAQLGVAETAPVASLPAHAVLQRVADGQDTDDNASDFCPQGEAAATPGAANASCPDREAALEVQFFDRFSRRDVQDVPLADSTYWVVDFAVTNTASLATTAPTGLVERAVQASDSSLVEVIDLPPAVGDSTLAPGERIEDAVIVICGAAAGEVVVTKTVAASNDPLAPATDRVTVSCDPDLLASRTGVDGGALPQEVAGPPASTPPEPPPLDGSYVAVEVKDAFGNEPLPDQDMVEGETVEATVEVRVTEWSGLTIRPSEENVKLWPIATIQFILAPAEPEMSLTAGSDPPPVILPDDPWTTSLQLTCNTAYDDTEDNGVYYGARGVVARGSETPHLQAVGVADTVFTTCASPPAVAAGQTEFDESGSGSTGQGGLVIMRSDGAGGYEVPEFLLGPLTDEELFGGMEGESFVAIRSSAIGEPSQASLWHAEDDGSGFTNLTNDAAFYRRGSGSPDGTQYVFESDRDTPRDFPVLELNDVFVMNADGSGITKVLSNAGFPSFTPNGRIVYSYDADADDHYEIRIADADGSNALVLIEDDDANNYSYTEAVVSPDGTRIAVTRENTSTFQSDIMVGDFDGTTVTNLTQYDTGGNWSPAWSPSGDRLAFASDRNGNAVDIWVGNADGTNIVNITNTANRFESHPFWIP